MKSPHMPGLDLSRKRILVCEEGCHSLSAAWSLLFLEY